MSLTDRFGRHHTYLRLGLTERCNLRCTYCMPASGVPLTPNGAHLTTDEIDRLAQLFVSAGVETIRLTGGEPLVRKDAVEVSRRLGRLGLQRLAITTNGLLLADRLADLSQAGVNAITISLDTLRADRFQQITRRPGLDRVLAALDAALAAGYAIGTNRPLKVNVVAMRGVNEDEAADFAALAAAEPVEVRFIEEMPFAGNGWTPASVVTMAETRTAIEAAHGPLAPVPARPTATAQLFSQPGWRGRVGFVASMSTPFCGTCDRVRVTADGALKVCLFGKAEVSLRDVLRAGASDAEVLALVRTSLAGKAAAHAGLVDLAADVDRPMVRIGG